MKNKITALLFILFPTLAYCQLAHIRITDAKTMQPVAGAELFSLQKPTIKHVSDKSGNAFIPLQGKDTLAVFKNYYHPFFMSVDVGTFHFDQKVNVLIVPAPELLITPRPDFSTLSSFEYHFVHDSISTNPMHITTYEQKDSYMLRPVHTDKAFHFADINLEKVHMKTGKAEKPSKK